MPGSRISEVPALRNLVPKWQWQTDGSVRSSPVVAADGTVYVTCTDGYVYSVDATGSLRWKFFVGMHGLSDVAIGKKGRVFVTLANGTIHALHPRKGLILWSSRVNIGIMAPPAVSSSGDLIVGARDGTVVSFLANDGTVLWEFSTRAEIGSAPCVTVNETIVVPSHDGRLYAVRGRNSTVELLWSTYIGPTHMSAAAVSLSTCFIGTNDGILHAIDLITGTKKWNVVLHKQHLVYMTPLVDHVTGMVYAGASDGILHALNTSTGLVEWQVNLDVYIASATGTTQGSLFRVQKRSYTKLNVLYIPGTSMFHQRVAAWQWSMHRTGQSGASFVLKPGI